MEIIATISGKKKKDCLVAIAPRNDIKKTVFVIGPKRNNHKLIPVQRELPIIYKLILLLNDKKNYYYLNGLARGILLWQIAKLDVENYVRLWLN